jgi:predicted nuclease with TOPRIM domain
MSTTLPQSVRDSWGEPAAEDFARWLDEYVQDRAVTRDEYREILSRLDVLENEVAGINDRLDRMEERFESRFDKMDERFESRFNQMDERIDRMHEQMRVMMRWTVGTIALFGTIVTVLLAIAEFAP